MSVETAQLDSELYRVETEKNKVIRREVVLRDKNDKVLGQVNYEMTKDVVYLNGESGEGGNKLLSLKLRSVDGRVFDVLRVANRHNVDILVNTGNETYKEKHPEYGEVVLGPFPDDQVNLAILLHELGHADQTRDREMYTALRLYTSPTPEAWYQYETFLDRIKKLDFLSTVTKDIEIKVASLVVLWKELNSVKKGTEKENELKRKIKSIQDSIKINELKEFLHVACENDASVRALAWIDKLEKFGINMLAPQKVTELTSSDNGAEIDDPYSRLQRGVLSYCVSNIKNDK